MPFTRAHFQALVNWIASEDVNCLNSEQLVISKLVDLATSKKTHPLHCIGSFKHGKDRIPAGNDIYGEDEFAKCFDITGLMCMSASSSAFVVGVN